MSAPPTATDIKTQLKTLLTPVIGTSGTKKTKILDYLPLAFLVADHEDITALRSSLDTTILASGATEQRVNCLMISERGFGQSPPQSDAARHERDARGRNLITRRFLLAYVYQFGIVSGVASENVFSANVEIMRTTLNDNPKLGFAVVAADGTAGAGQYVKQHNGLQAPSMLPEPFAGVICHVTEMNLEVVVIEGL